MNKFNFDKIKKSKKPYFIAEAGVNHEGSMKDAKKLIDAAKAGGADAIKFQTYKASKIASKNSPHYWSLLIILTSDSLRYFCALSSCFVACASSYAFIPPRAFIKCS